MKFMKHFLREEDIIIEKPPFHEATLVGGDDQWEDGCDSCRQDLGDDLVNDVAEANGAVVGPSCGKGLFGDKDNTCGRDATGKEGPVEELLNCLNNI